ncbi:MAG: UDP-2,3-diacylglucosamine diphosphatase [Alteromonadaceae bacterium]|nr:MAG: UDP-2,3-diacylglucosamine diphosphatase [Alteromonadaceae bacterium]
MTALAAPTYFISDLHLEASRPEITQAFHHFLNNIAHDAGVLYILGDFFNAWFGDDNGSDFIESVKTTLREYSAKGVKVYFIHGNRDFLIGERFAQEAGLTLLPEVQVINLHGREVVVLHGDSMCTADTDYMAFRERVRDPAWQKKALGRPLWLRRMVAAYLRSRSKKSTMQKSAEITDVTPATVAQVFEQYGCTTMIHGHTHRPKRHQLSTALGECERIVLGDWAAHGWYLKADEGGLDLCHFTPEESPESSSEPSS